MPTYKAPLDDMRFVLHDVLNVGSLTALPGYEAADVETVNEFLNMTARFAEEVLFPLNASGDREGCSYDPATKGVKAPSGFDDAYQQFIAQGLTAITGDPAYGGLGMPHVLNTALGEMFCSANLAFSLYPGLSHGAYTALHTYGSDELKDTYLPKLVSGEWSGTMCLTEPHSGTDLGLIKTKAVKQEDGSFKITGNKIFISAGEHEMAGNICHLVLARIDDPSTPPGIKGISLFIVPKHLPDASGEPDERNSAYCTGLEHKMGINGNATCAMSFDDAKGFLVGEPHKGMRGMFVMMNEARLMVGLQGQGISEVAYQNAVEYAQNRLQGTAVTDKDPEGKRLSIIEHAGVRRDLMTMKSTSEAGRALAYYTGMQLDIAHKHPDKAVRQQAQDVVDILIPVVKAHLTDLALQNASAGMQVHGGHGFIKETGVEQYVRDARITMIYEGTNGIQALDLLGRKVLQQNLLGSYLASVEADINAAKTKPELKAMAGALQDNVAALKKAERRLKMGALTNGKDSVAKEASASAADFLTLMSTVAMSQMWLKMGNAASDKIAANDVNKDFYATKLDTARFYFDRVAPEAEAAKARLRVNDRSLMAIAAAAFSRTQGTVAENPAPAVPQAAKPAKSGLDKLKFWR